MTYKTIKQLVSNENGINTEWVDKFNETIKEKMKIGYIPYSKLKVIFRGENDKYMYYIQTLIKN